MELINYQDKSSFLPSDTARMIGFMRPYLRDLKETLGRHVSEQHTFSEETVNNSVDAPITREIVDRWTRGLIRVNENGVREVNPGSSITMYVSYLRQFLHNSSTDIEDAVAGTLDAYPEQSAYFRTLSNVGNPLVASTTLFLYDYFRRLSKPGKKKITTWYENIFENIIEADHHASKFLDTLKYRQNKISHNPQADQFLEELKLEIQRNIGEVMAYTNGYAISSLTSQSNGFMVSSMNVGISPRDFRYAVQEIYGLDRGGTHRDGRPTIMSQYAQNIFDDNSRLSEEDGYLFMPVCTSSFDGLKYSEFVRDFWKALSPQLDRNSPHQNISFDGDSAKYRLGDVATLLFRPFPRKSDWKVTAQARMALLGEGKFDRLSIRVDDEGDRLRVDMGGTTFEKGLAHGEGILLVDEIEPADSVMSGISDVYRFYEKHGFGPSIMKPLEILYSRDGILDPFTLSDKVALMTSVMHSNAAGLGMRMDSFFGHHSDSLNKEEFRQNFQAIMLSCASAVEFPVS